MAKSMNQLVSMIRYSEDYKGFRKWTLIFLAMAIILLMLGVNPIVALFIIVAIGSMYPQRFMQGLGFEMCTFFTVLTTMAFGPAPGLLVGKISNTAGMIFAGNVDHILIYDFFAFIGMAIISSFFSGAYIVPVGIAIVIMYNVGYYFYTKSIAVYDGSDMMYNITNVVLNILLFWKLGPMLIGLLA